MPWDPLLQQMTKAAPAGTPSPPSGPAGGDLSGTYPNPTVARIRGALLGTTTATSGHLLIGDGAAWQSVAMIGDATISAAGSLTLANTAVMPGTYGNATNVGQFTVDSKGRITFAQNVAISASSVGPQGPPGPAGEDGEDGMIGPPGPQGPPGSGSSLTPVQFKVSFGSTPTWEKTVVITDGSLTTGQQIFVQASLTDNTGVNPANAFAEAFTTFVEEAWVSGGFSVRVVSLQGPVVGDYWFSYVII